MKLLNVWPQEQVVRNPKRRFVLELILALLLGTALLMMFWLWLNWRLLNAMDAHKTLKHELDQLNQTRVVEVSSGAQMPRVMRQLLVGQLDWMGELPQWMMNDRVRWVSARLDDKGLKLEGMALSGEAISTMVDLVKQRYPNPPVQVRHISSVVYAGQNLWRFEMDVDLQTLQNKVELSAHEGKNTEPAPSNTPNTPAPHAPAPTKKKGTP